MKTNTKWYAYENLGSYFKLIDGTLMQAPMNIDGSISEPDDPLEVDWDRIDPLDAEGLKDVKAELEQSI